MKSCSDKVIRIALMLGSASLVLSATSLLAADGSATAPATGSGSATAPVTGSGSATAPIVGNGTSGFYLGMDLGLNVASDLTENIPDVGSGSISQYPGLRLDISAGYAFKLSDQFTLAPEVEVGVMVNALNEASVPGAGTASVQGYFTQVPLMVNGVLNWQFDPNWDAYVGAGVGRDYMSLDITSVAGESTSITGSESDAAWQFMLGIQYKYGSSELGLGYKYLAVQPSGMSTVGNSAILLCYVVHF